MRRRLALVGLLVGCVGAPVMGQGEEAPPRAACCAGVDFVVYVGAPRHPSPGCRGTDVHLFDRRLPPGELLTVEAVPRAPRVDGRAVFVPAHVADVDALWEQYPHQRTMWDHAGVPLCWGTFAVTYPSAEGGLFQGQGAFTVYHLPGMKRDPHVVRLVAEPVPGRGTWVSQRLDWRRVR